MNLQRSKMSPTSTTYPESIGRILPNRTLHLLGNLHLLGTQAVGICGSRDASSQALELAHRFGQEVATRGITVVSGYARGVDRQAHEGALAAGGTTIAVLPEGLDKFRMVHGIDRLVDSDNFLAVSMFEPNATWQTWRAMERNKLIVGLSLGVLVVEARERGGTIAAAKECVNQGKPLWAIAYSQDGRGREGNRKLLQEAALPLKRLDDLREALDQAVSGATEEVGQLVMNLGS